MLYLTSEIVKFIIFTNELHLSCAMTYFRIRVKICVWIIVSLGRFKASADLPDTLKKCDKEKKNQKIFFFK